MYVVDVFPLVPTAPASSLSYRHARRLVPGQLVRVPLRRKRVPGVVVASVPLQEAKAELKAAPFVLAGEVVPGEDRIPEAVMEAVARIASWHATSSGAVLAQLFLEFIKSGADLSFRTLEAGPGFSIDAAELPLAKRANRYRAAITTALNQDTSALLVASSLAEVEYWRRELGEFSPLILTGALAGARRKAMIMRAQEARTLIIATPAFSWVPIARLGAIIIERVGAGGFKLPKRPYLDIRVTLLELARARDTVLMQGDFPLPLEYRAGTRKLALPDHAITVVDARTDTSLPQAMAMTEDEPWSAVPKKLHERVREVTEGGGRAVIVAVRKGYAPVVVCRDCGQALKDERGNVFSYHQSPSGERIFRTSDGKSELGTKTTCPHCGSWNLLPLGVGVARVHEELSQAFPGAVTLFDAESVRTAAGARKVLAAFSFPGSILVGSEAMLPWLLAHEPAPVDLAGIASADTLLALPFWRARERFLRLGLMLADMANEVVIATRLPDDTAVQQLAEPSSNVFFAEEAALRRALGYPPFGTLIALQFEGREQGLVKTEAMLRERLSDFVLRTAPDRRVSTGTVRRSLVLLLPKDAWPDDALAARLASLPPSVRILIDPEGF